MLNHLRSRRVYSVDITGTSFFDHDRPISGFAGHTLLKENTPFIDIPDSNVQDVYYYRWSSIVSRFLILKIERLNTEFGSINSTRTE
jgi:hypothetical protein